VLDPGPSGILVTSALHMPRALISFEGHGVELIPASTDVEIVPGPLHVLYFLPGAEALAGTTRAVHELIGLAYCHLLGC
jgi:uncharacterized SAM-binding protein YcdF (DUF218 family)